MPSAVEECSEPSGNFTLCGERSPSMLQSFLICWVNVTDKYICFDIDCWNNLVYTVVLVVCVVSLELMIIMTYTPSHNVVEQVVSPVCHCDRCGRCLAYSITFPESLCGSYWDVKPCKEQFTVICRNMCTLVLTLLVTTLFYFVKHTANAGNAVLKRQSASEIIYDWRTHWL